MGQCFLIHMLLESVLGCIVPHGSAEGERKQSLYMSGVLDWVWVTILDGCRLLYLYPCFAS